MITAKRTGRKNAIIGTVSLGGKAAAFFSAALEIMIPDAVLSDINLPDGDGVNFCMHNAPRFPATMWLLMSGNDDLVRLGGQLKGIGGAKPTFAIVEKPVPLRLLDRFIAGIGSAPPSVIEPVTAVATAATAA